MKSNNQISHAIVQKFLQWDLTDGLEENNEDMIINSLDTMTAYWSRFPFEEIYLDNLTSETKSPTA